VIAALVAVPTMAPYLPRAEPLRSMCVINRRVLAAALLLGPASAKAHHGFGGRYDTSRPIWLAGRVVRASFSPPHPVLAVAVANEGVRALPNPLPAELSGTPAPRAELNGQTVEIEFPPVQTFYALGQRVAVGAEVEIIALRNCAAPHQLRSQWIRLADGAVILRDGRLAYMVNGCG
jgi:hypothetical protein